jgi:hypothetical protein
MTLRSTRPQSGSRIRVSRKRPTIGLDYGTHSTKVVVRARGEEVGNIVRIDSPCDDYPCNASPSVIKQVDDRLYFGTSAVQKKQGIDFGSLKADLVNAPSDEPELLEQIEILTTTYLAWILCELLKLDAGLMSADPIVQLSAPTNHSGDPILNERYLRIANACYRLVFEERKVFRQAIRYEEARLWTRRLLQSPLPPADERRFFVMPETIAPVVSLQQEPILDPGMYVIADMGASTTEVSVFLVHNQSIDNKILCYNDSTDFQGGIELASYENLTVRLSEQKLDAFMKRMESQINRAWYLGFQKDMGSSAAKEKWKSLQFLLTGGATLNRHVSAKFKAINPIMAWPANEVRIGIGRHIPSTLNYDGNMDPDELSKFAVANGLAIERARWPRFYLEDELEPLGDTHSKVVAKMPSYLEIG